MYALPYLQIAERLNQELNKTAVKTEHGKLDFIARFNNQFSREELENAVPKPAILIQFLPTTWTTKGKQIQEGESTIVIHIGMKTLADDNFFSDTKTDALKTDAYVDIVHRALQGFAAPCLGALSRISSETDEDHSEIFVEKLFYSSVITDASTSTDIGKTIVATPEIVVEAEAVEEVSQDSPYVVKTIRH